MRVETCSHELEIVHKFTIVTKTYIWNDNLVDVVLTLLRNNDYVIIRRLSVRVLKYIQKGGQNRFMNYFADHLTLNHQFKSICQSLFEI